MNTSTETYTFAQKWGDDPFVAMGYTQAPDALVEYSARLGLKSEECWLIVCILKFKHTPDNPYPSQARLAKLIGQSEDTVRRILKRIERQGLLHVERVRGDLGHFTHSIYDFTPLRRALNEAYYQEHPQERPKKKLNTGTSPTTVQKCTVVKPPRKIMRNHPAKSAVTTMQNCGPNKTLRTEEIKTNKQTPQPPVKQRGVKPETAAGGLVGLLENVSVLDEKPQDLLANQQGLLGNQTDAINAAAAAAPLSQEAMEVISDLRGIGMARAVAEQTVQRHGQAACRRAVKHMDRHKYNTPPRLVGAILAALEKGWVLGPPPCEWVIGGEAQSSARDIDRLLNEHGRVAVAAELERRAKESEAAGHASRAARRRFIAGGVRSGMTGGEAVAAANSPSPQGATK